MCWHKWGKWEDVDLAEVSKVRMVPSVFITYRQVIKQQRRCEKCNLVQTINS
jgi:hypothetical protein